MPRANNGSKTALLVDGTSLFYAIREKDNQFNYHAYLAQIKEHLADLPTEWPPKPCLFFTSADPENEGQAKFHHFLRSKTILDVSEEKPRLADARNPLLSSQDYDRIRFDGKIAYAMGSLVARKWGHIVVCSDSWVLSPAIRDAIDQGVGVTLVFFASLVDPRFTSLLREGSDLDFLDLDEHEDSLFNFTKQGQNSVSRQFPGLHD